LKTKEKFVGMIFSYQESYGDKSNAAVSLLIDVGEKWESMGRRALSRQRAKDFNLS
jgi:hypothetical protein